MLDVEYIPIYAMVLGFVLDAIIGDPYSWPHPIKRFGCLIAYAENRWNKGNNKTLKGGVVSLVLISSTWVIYYGLQDVLLSVDKWFLLIVSIILVFYGLANRTLINEGLKVINALEKEGIEAGRKQVGFIVGRDTSQLSPQQIYTAVLETLSENLSDGVIAPLFYYAIGGFPLMFTYKMINTLDSMIGYKSDRYKQFGMVAAKIDDVANYIPARLTALIMVIISLSYRGLTFIFKYGHKHASPNAGYPESALAGILNCRFGGPNVYHGKLVEKPFIGENNRDIVHADVIKTCWVNAGSSIIMVALALLFLLL